MELKKLELEKLPEIIDVMVKRDCLIQIGNGHSGDGGNDKITLHIFKSHDGYYFILTYSPIDGENELKLKTKKATLNRIKKYLDNGDISPTYEYFG